MAMGSSTQRPVSQGEMINRENLAKSLVAKAYLPAGHVITKDDVDIKSPGRVYRQKNISIDR